MSNTIAVKERKKKNIVPLSRNQSNLTSSYIDVKRRCEFGDILYGDRIKTSVKEIVNNIDNQWH